jgi:hypothetical protein
VSVSPWCAPLRRQGVGDCVQMRLDTVILAAGTVRIATPMDMCHQTLPNSPSGIGLRAWRLGTSTPGTSSLATSFLGLFSVRYIAPPTD